MYPSIPVLHHIHHTPGTPTYTDWYWPGWLHAVRACTDRCQRVIGLGLRAIEHVTEANAINGVNPPQLIVLVGPAST